MRYEDVEELAMEYIEAKKKPYIAPKIIDPIAERKWIQEMTQKLKLEEFLCAVQEDKWQTGTISPVNMPWSHTYSTPAQGFVLHSDPYHVVTFQGTGRNTKAQVHQEKAALSIFVTGRNEEFDRTVHVIDTNIYDLTNFRHPIYKAIQFFGIEYGFRKSLSWPKIKNFQTQVDPNNLSAVANAIEITVNERERKQSLPQSLYSLSRETVKQIPELITKGSFSAKELRNWAYANQGTPWCIRQLDRALPKLIQL